MISFNALGYESANGEPNTWEPRVSSLEKLIPPPVVSDELWEKISRREIDACFDRMEADEDTYWDALEGILEEIHKEELMEEVYEKMREESRREWIELLSNNPESPSLADEHAQQKARRAQRRERKLHDKLFD